jgi:hypothetical protein
MMFDLSPASAMYLGAAILDTVRRHVGVELADLMWEEACRRAGTGRADYNPSSRRRALKAP